MDRAGPDPAPAADVPAATAVKPAAPAVSTAAILDAYSTIHLALNADRLTAVAQAAGTIAAKSAKAGDAFAPVRAAAVTMQSAANLAAARAVMGPLSDTLIALSRAGTKLDGVNPPTARWRASTGCSAATRFKIRTTARRCPTVDVSLEPRKSN